MNYTTMTSTVDYTNSSTAQQVIRSVEFQNGTYNDASKYLYNIRVEGIPETYGVGKTGSGIEDVMSNEGILYVKVGSSTSDDVTTYTYHVYDLLEIESETSISAVAPFDNFAKNNVYKHIWALTYDSAADKYVLEPNLLGEEDGKYIYSIPVDSPDGSITSSYDGNFYSTAKLGNISTFYLFYKPYFYIRSGIAVKVTSDNSTLLQLGTSNWYYCAAAKDTEYVHLTVSPEAEEDAVESVQIVIA